ncbi:MAG: hypothetical protein Tp178MES00d2C33159091_39 [Prokaryotic dsDNA virus sp.]|uniref:hypothetical protein n=1 Tax=Thalassospira sp. TaxID=1912094 RepID=UPI000C3505BF|nr:hypothetical protein [Thalassospira sp.]QDP60988.1 MAG: hypothetical protein Tp178MES00d2C33159091_39 [Prokaryotic dsDNA virus sp.]MAZ33825.1 hypothetical protein [Thalassospira sp.]MAZ33881.1 hypothetical protein [Thalassospira sp.]MAZ34626.1 hypothetical protein [Thalassospira sp.]QDP64507.1 MAG: hypothetical protein Tp178SUR1139111_27 [Prokaryotic dsDNA virus sp.]|tara:strand:+ start:2672 stop:3400 length:729 start_codon:yes stop_codon:yes gene_type:complete
MADIFSKDPIEENENNNEITLSFEDLVGEGKKYANPDELAKAYANADGFIQTSKAEKARLEAENKVLKDLAEARKKSNSEEQPRGQEPDPAGQRPNEDDNKEDLSAKIAEMMNERDTQKKFTDNVNSVSEKLANHYGSGAKAQKALQDKAAELKVDVSWLMDMAGRSPEALYRTVGLDSKSFSSPNASSGDVNTAALNRNANRRNFKYYEELRKADSRAYYSPHVQRELMKDAREQGAKFYE